MTRGGDCIPVAVRKVNTMSQVIQKFSFNGDVLDVCLSNGTLWVSVKRVCEALGITSNRQAEKLKELEWATTTIMVAVAEDGKSREMLMLDLDSLPMWLATLNPEKCEEGSRPKIVRYQIECSKVLRDHFFGKSDTVDPSKAETAALTRECLAILAEPKPAHLTFIADDVWHTFKLGMLEPIIGRQLQLAAPASEYAGYMTLTEIANHLELKSSRQAGKLALEAGVRTKPDTDIEGLCKLVLVSGNGTNGIRKQPTFSPKAVARIKEKYNYNMAYGTPRTSRDDCNAIRSSLAS